MLFARHPLLVLALISVICLPQFQLKAQMSLEEILAADEGFDELEEAFEEPAAVGDDLGPDALHFFFLSSTPVKRNFYYLEDGEYRTIQPAFNTFGNVHRVSRRAKLELCDKSTQIVDGEQVVVYVPQFALDVANRSNLFAVFLPSVDPIEGQVINMSALDFSEKVFPFNQFTFVNTLPMPVMVLLEDERTLLKPGQVARTGYSIRRKGVGYVRVALAVRDASGGAKLLYNQRMAVYEDERMIAIPIADPWGLPEVQVLTYRDTGIEPE